MTSERANIVFMGSPDFAVPTLEALQASGRYAPRLVVSQPDRPRGRGQQTTPTPVRARAREFGIDTLVMSRENYADVVAEVAQHKPDAVVVVAFGVIVKADLLEMPRFGCINVHGSLLPKYRGVSPIQAAIIAGEAVTGCTTMRMDEGIDTGDILLAEETEISATDTAGSLTDRLSRIGAHLLVRTLDGLFDGSVTPVPQDETPTKYTRKIKKHHGRIKWSRSADDVERRLRAMTPWPSAYTFAEGKRLIITEAAVDPDVSGEPGEVISLEPLRVACGDGALEILKLKPEGKRAMAPSAFLSGHRLAVGMRLGDD